MNSLRPCAALLLALVLGVCCAADLVEEKSPDGKVRLKYTIDERGRKNGAFSEFYDSGKLRAKGAFASGFKDGAYTVQTPAGRVVYSATYKAGLLEGPYTVHDAQGGVRVSMTFKDGKLDGLVKLVLGGKTTPVQEFKAGVPPLMLPFGDVQAALAVINNWSAPAKKGSDIASERREALRRLQSYRAIAGVPWEGLELDDEMNRHAEAGAQLCEAIGRLDHRPANPGWPEDKYQVGFKGTSSSNLFMGAPDLARSVDGYMDDSDATNIDRVGHRRWCLNPVMLKTGFGRSGKFAAMWSFDASRKNVPDYPFISFPPPGLVPAGSFQDHFAWHVTPNPKHYRRPASTSIQVKVWHKTDRNPDKPGEAMKVTNLQVAEPGPGQGSAIIFRPENVHVAEGARYLVEVEGLQKADGTAATIRFFVIFLGG